MDAAERQLVELIDGQLKEHKQFAQELLNLWEGKMPQSNEDVCQMSGIEHTPKRLYIVLVERFLQVGERKLVSFVSHTSTSGHQDIPVLRQEPPGHYFRTLKDATNFAESYFHTQGSKCYIKDVSSS